MEAVSITPEWEEQVRAGALRLLLLATEKRLASYPDVPTYAEKGYDFPFRSICTIWVPSKTSSEVVTTLIKALSPAAKAGDVRDILEKFHLLPNVIETEELTKFVKEDYEFNKKFFKELGIGIYKKD